LSTASLALRPREVLEIWTKHLTQKHLVVVLRSDGVGLKLILNENLVQIQGFSAGEDVVDEMRHVKLVLVSFLVGVIALNCHVAIECRQVA